MSAYRFFKQMKKTNWIKLILALISGATTFLDFDRQPYLPKYCTTFLASELGEKSVRVTNLLYKKEGTEQPILIPYGPLSLKVTELEENKKLDEYEVRTSLQLKELYNHELEEDEIVPSHVVIGLVKFK